MTYLHREIAGKCEKIMKENKLKLKLAGSAFLLFGALCAAAPVEPLKQPELDSDGNITVRGDDVLTLSTPDLTQGSFTYVDSVKILPGAITHKDADLSSGIKGTIYHGGYIDLVAYIIDDDRNKHEIYHVTKETTVGGENPDGSFNDSAWGYTQRSISITSSTTGEKLGVRGDAIKQTLSSVKKPFAVDKEIYKRGGWMGALYGGTTGFVIGLFGSVLIGLLLMSVTGGLSAGLSLYSLGLLFASTGVATGAGAGIGALIGHYTDDPVQSHVELPIANVGISDPPPWDEITDLEFVQFPTNQPVVIEMEIKNAAFEAAKVPGIGYILPMDFFLRLAVKVNGDDIQESPYLIPQNALNGPDIAPLDIDLGTLTMGDTVTFEVNSPYNSIPYIRNVPDVWIARFAGDLMYYASPSVVPGSLKPFLGYDTRVHNLMLRTYPEGVDRLYDHMLQNVDTRTWTWSWTLRRRMDASKTTYSYEYEWPKTKTLTNPITLLDGTKSYQQRNNQKEGLNMQYLTYWSDWNVPSAGFQKYEGTKYMLGFDDDELAMFGTPYVSPQDDPNYPSSSINILKLERLPWKETPEGPQSYNSQTGYPESGFVLNEMVTAYWKANNSLFSYDYDKYDGYEIQDLGTSPDFPDGNAAGNNTAPGLINIQVLKKPINLSLTVGAPLTEDKGFYGSIEGTTWPAYGEQDVPYTLTGLRGLPLDELNKFSLEYEYEDKLGQLKRQTRYLNEEDEATKQSIRNDGEWTAEFDIHLPAYASVTAYYQRNEDSLRVMIAGKELKAIFLLFTGVQKTSGREDLQGNLDLSEGKGIGSKIWLEDFRNRQYDGYEVARQFGDSTRYTKKYTREYVFHVGDRVTFVTFDGDPHTFYSDDPEWYLSSRSMAKRVRDDYLDGSHSDAEDAYLKFYLTDLSDKSSTPVLQTAGRLGKEFTKTWDQNGIYEMEVSYRNSSNLYYLIKVANYGDDTVTREPVRGRVVQRELKEWERAMLNINETNMQVAEVADIYSRYAYVDGPRATTPKENRWAEQRDFDATFTWEYTDAQGTTTTHQNPSQVSNFVNASSDQQDFWDNWAHHYSSNWMTPPASDGGQGLPPGLTPDDVTRIYDEKSDLDPYSSYIKNNLFSPVPPAEWQYTIPLASATKHQGMRQRTNPSCIYDLNQVFDPEHGAFSGAPNVPPSAESIQAPNPSDTTKDRNELYHKLKAGRMIVFDASSYSIANFAVYNLDPSVERGQTFIARGGYKQ